MAILFCRSRLMNTFNGTRVYVILSRRSTMFNAKNRRAVEFIRAFYGRVIGRSASMNLIPSRYRQFTAITVSIYISTNGSSLSTYFFMANDSICLSNGRRILSCFQFRHVFRLNKIRMVVFSNMSQAVSCRILGYKCFLRYHRLCIRKR